MVFTRVLAILCFRHFFEKKYTVKGAVLAIWEVWGASWGVSWGRPGAVPGPQRASWAHPWCDLGPHGGLLGASWGQFGTQKGPWRPLERAKNIVFTRVFFLHFLVLGSFASKTTALRALGSDLGASGGVLGAPGGGSGPPRALLGPSWGRLGASWAPPGRLLGASWGHFWGPKKRLGGLLGPIFGPPPFLHFFEGPKSQKPVKTNVF